MGRKEIFILVIAVLAAGFWFFVFGGGLKQKQVPAAPAGNSIQIDNQKQNPDQNSGSIDLVRPPFLDE